MEDSSRTGSTRTAHALNSAVPDLGSLALIVGPEGGWSQEERAQADAAGCIAVTLGRLTLRADAVAVAAMAIARFALKDL